MSRPSSRRCRVLLEAAAPASFPSRRRLDSVPIRSRGREQGFQALSSFTTANLCHPPTPFFLGVHASRKLVDISKI
ncbi:hypothetical protein CGRA01v4_02080 [Colletotrichum graminicola]|nr:hypothetical protein CGRA01v4_02080 [Colletotrichum graminicola]